ncbi:MAG TPA: L-histidine N(alpha)-methyltransferase, partial [Candidatus Acidoferrum sp.]|nr:L-histidine N(alpha)-methyltransferase [Candidatus Acidoferrum sp.]
MLTQPLLKPAVSPALLEFAADVRTGLTKSGQREILSKYLYDEVGSALFEAICLLPEYGLTRADSRLLRRYAGEMVTRMPLPAHVAELGSGSGKKTRWILEAIARRQPTYYYPIEISPAALAACEKELGQIDLVHIVGFEKPYLEGLQSVA